MAAGGVETEETPAAFVVEEISMGRDEGGGIISPIAKSSMIKASPGSLSLGLMGEGWCEEGGRCCWC